MRNGRRRRAAPKEKPASPEEDGVTPELKALADAIKREFVQRRRQLAPGATSGVDPKHNPHFIRAARMAQAYGESAGVFVHRQLSHIIKSGGAMYPQAIGSEKVAMAARTGRVDRDDVLLCRYRSQLEKWDLYCSFGSAANTLRSYRSEFSPLLCFLMATRLNEHAIAEECREAAGIEYRSSEVAAEIFGDEVEGLL